MDSDEERQIVEESCAEIGARVEAQLSEAAVSECASQSETPGLPSSEVELK